MSPTSTYMLSFAELAGTGAVEALVGGSGVQIFLSLKAIGGSEKRRTHDISFSFSLCFICQVTFFRKGHKHSF